MLRDATDAWFMADTAGDTEAKSKAEQLAKDIRARDDKGELANSGNQNFVNTENAEQALKYGSITAFAWNNSIRSNQHTGKGTNNISEGATSNKIINVDVARISNYAAVKTFVWLNSNDNGPGSDDPSWNNDGNKFSGNHGHSSVLYLNSEGSGTMFSFYPAAGSPEPGSEWGEDKPEYHKNKQTPFFGIEGFKSNPDYNESAAKTYAVNKDNAEMRRKFMSQDDIFNFSNGGGKISGLTIKDQDGKTGADDERSEDIERYVAISVDSSKGLLSYNNAQALYEKPGKFYGAGRNCNDISISLGVTAGIPQKSFVGAWITDDLVNGNLKVPNWTYDALAEWSASQNNNYYGGIKGLSGYMSSTFK